MFVSNFLISLENNAQILWKYIVSGIVFLYFLQSDYKGTVGRIEGINQYTKRPQYLGPVREKEKIALFEGRHKALAFRQALISSVVYAGLLLGILLCFFKCLNYSNDQRKGGRIMNLPKLHFSFQPQSFQAF